MPTAIGRIAVMITADPRAAARGIASVRGEIQLLSRTASRTSKGIKSLGSAFLGAQIKANALSRAASAIVGGLGSLVNQAMDLEQSLAMVTAVTDGSAKDMENLRRRAKELGRTTVFTSAQVAQGMTVFAKAGHGVKGAYDGVEHALNLAMISGIDVAEAAELTTSIMAGMGKEARELKDVVDILAVGMTKAKVEASELAESFKFAGPIADDLGMSVKDTAEALVLLAKAGIKGSEAGTALRRLSLILTGPAAEGREQMKQLGIEVGDAKGEFLGFANIVGQFNRSLKGMGGVAKQGTLTKIFQRRGTTPIQALMKIQEKDRAAIEEAFGARTGRADRMRKILEGTGSSAIKKMVSALADMVETIYNAVAPGLKAFVGWIQDIVNAANDGSGGIIRNFKDMGANLGPIVSDIGTGIAWVGKEIIPIVVEAMRTLAAVVGATWRNIRNIFKLGTESTLNETTTWGQGIGAAWDWVSTRFKTGLRVIAFGFNHFEDLLALSGKQIALWAVTAAAKMGHFFTKELPAFAEWAGENIPTMIWEIFKNALTTISNFAHNVSVVFSELWDFIASGGSDDIDFSAAVGLDEGWVRTWDAFEGAGPRVVGEREQGLIDEVAKLKREIGRKFGEEVFPQPPGGPGRNPLAEEAKKRKEEAEDPKAAHFNANPGLYIKDLMDKGPEAALLNSREAADAILRRSRQQQQNHVKANGEKLDKQVALMQQLNRRLEQGIKIEGLEVAEIV